MKINSQWSQNDWEEALKKVFKLSRNFEEIIQFGLDNNFITEKDIMEAAEVCTRNFTDEELGQIIENKGLCETMKVIKEKYDLDEILDELPKYDILDTFNDDELLDAIENTWTLDSHDDDVREEYHRDLYEQVREEIENENEKEIQHLKEGNPDDLHKFVCDILGIGYYDKKGLEKGLKELKERMNKNSYGMKYD